MNNQKILLIDYDPASISKTATPLTKAGYSVEVAKDGLSGLAAFERMKPALVLVEAMLPRKHGFEVCQEIKARPDGKSTPVLITSAVCRGRKYRMDALQIYGCDEYIEKPIPDAELVTLIKRLIDEAAHATEEVKQDLSAAIDTAAADAPSAIESMSDDELEAKIDSLLLGDETETETAPAPAQPAPVAVMPAPAETEPVSEPEVVTGLPEEIDSNAVVEFQPDAGEGIAAAEVTEPEPEPEPDPEPEMQIVATTDHEAAEVPAAGVSTESEPAFDAKTEMERRVEAMVQVDTEKIDTPMIDPLPAAADEDPFKIEESEVAEMPQAETASADAASADAVPEWTETATPKKGGSKAMLIGVAAVVILGVVGFLAFQQGWIGGTSEPAGPAEPSPALAKAAAETEPAASGAQPASAQPATPAQSNSNEATPEAKTAPPVAEPESVEVARNVEPRPELPPKPAPYKGMSQAERAALQARSRKAEQAMVAAAGSLQSALLTENLPEPVSENDEPAGPVDVDVDLLGTPVPPKPMRGQLFDITDVDTIPVPKKFTQPVYDELARRMRHQGEVLVAVLVDENGQVSDVELIKEIPRSRLNAATVTAARRWTYEPAIKDGVAVSVWKTERVLFTLE